MTVETANKRPSKAAIEAHFDDDGGARPVAADFDAAPDEICGNGRSFYHLTRLAKPLPAGWTPPPPPGTDPSYRGPEPTAPFKESPYALATAQVVRARKPIVEKWERAFRDELTVRLAEIPGSLAVTEGRDAAVGFPGLEDRLLAVEPALFDGADEKTAAAALLARGVSLLLVDRTLPRVAPWTEERMSSVRLRLRDAGDLAWFHPLALSSGWALYRVAPPLRLSDEDKARLTAQARAVLGGETPGPWSPEAPLSAVGLATHRAVVSLRLHGDARIAGRKLAKRMSKDEDLAAAVRRAAARLRDEWPRIRATVAKEYGVTLPAGPAEALPRMQVEIDVLHDVCLLADRAPEALLWQVQPGLDGIMLHDEIEGVAHYLEPSHAVHNAIGTPVLFFEAMLKKSRLRQFLRPARTEAHRRTRGDVLFETAWAADSRFRFTRFRSLNWIEDLDGAIVSLFRGVPLKRPADVTREALVKALRLGAGWLMRHQKEDGQYSYAYRPTNPPAARWSAGGNIVRHALNPYTLLLVHGVAPDPALLASAKRGIDHTLSFLRWKGERCVICHRDPPAPYHNAKLGSNAVTILSLLKLAEVEGIGAYEAPLRGLAEEILFMQDPNGHFRQYDVPVDHPYYGAENTIVPGEAVIALARMHKWSGDDRYKEAIDRALPYYMRQWRDWRDARSPEGVWDEERRVNLVGIVPWLVMALKDLHDSTGEDAYAALAFELQDWLDAAFFYTPERSRWPDWLGASFKAHVEQPAINSCQYIEGAAAAFALGRRLGDDVERRRQVVLLGVRFCLQLQHDGYGSTFFLPEPDSVMGGFRYTLAHLHLRNDYSYHAMNALAQAVQYLAPEDYAATEAWG